MEQANAPLVSILVRSMDRPSLARALDSAAAQTWPNIEIVVVAACGAAHRDLPASWHGRPLRLVRAPDGRALPRPDAANLALESARGAWLNFLDDDDVLAAPHVATLLAAPRPGGERVLYARTRVLDAGGHVLGHISHAGNAVQLYFHSRATTCATLFARSLVDEGVRFDPAFRVHEDHDFQVHCATRTAFVFVDAVTSTWHADAGESGCGFGANSDAAQRHAAVMQVRQKWAAWFRTQLADVDAVLATARAYVEGGDMQAAATCFEIALGQRAYDITLLHDAAQAQRRAGQRDRAAALLARALAFAPADARLVALRADIERDGGVLPEAPALPLVSILIRSMDRPSLAAALDSAAAQTWPNLEIVVVAANGQAHRALPASWQGRPLRLVRPDPDRRLPRPDAANLALDAARGEWLNFLDDDDALLPAHLATLLGAPRAAGVRVLYSRARVHDTDGRLRGHVGFASFPVQLYFQSRSHPAATLFHRSLVDDGLRFDTTFDVYEDQDFFIHCATRSEFQFVDAATCIWNAYAGESGCGHGANDAPAQRNAYLARLREKWRDFFAPLLAQPQTLLFVGQQYVRVNDTAAALDCLERALALLPNDVNALNLCGMAHLRAGHAARAESLFNEALRLVPDHAGLQRNLALSRRGAQAAQQQ